MMPFAFASTAYGGQMRCGPSHVSSYLVAHSSGVSNGSCGSNSSTNSMNRSPFARCTGAWVESQCAATDIVRGPGKSSSLWNQPRELS